MTTHPSAQNSCYFDNTAFTVVSLVFTLIPLAIAVIITAIMGVVIWRFSDTVLEHPGWLFVKTKRFARFAGLVFVTMISATFYTVLLALWIPAHFSRSGKEVNRREWRERNPVLTKLNLTSVLWEGALSMRSVSQRALTSSHSHHTATVLLYLRRPGRDI